MDNYVVERLQVQQIVGETEERGHIRHVQDLQTGKAPAAAFNDGIKRIILAVIARYIQFFKTFESTQR